MSAKSTKKRGRPARDEGDAAARLSWRKRESASARFARIGEKRVRRAVHDIKLIANLGSPNYEVSEEAVSRIERELRASVAEAVTKLRLRARGVAIDASGFSLTDLIGAGGDGADRDAGAGEADAGLPTRRVRRKPSQAA